MHKIVEREDYFAAAIDILADTDHSGLKMGALCRRLSVTTGSFYNYFGNWAGFKTAFLEYWRDERTVHLAEAARREVDPEHAVAALIDFACALPHRAESAIRAWSHSDPEVRRVQAVVDEQRFEVTFETLCTTIEDRDVAETIAQLCRFILTGYQLTQPLPDPAYLRRSLEKVNDEMVKTRGAMPASPR